MCFMIMAPRTTRGLILPAPVTLLCNWFVYIFTIPSQGILPARTTHRLAGVSFWAKGVSNPGNGSCTMLVYACFDARVLRALAIFPCICPRLISEIIPSLQHRMVFQQTLFNGIQFFQAYR